MDVKKAVERYLAVAGRFGQPMPLDGFGLPEQELVEMLEAWDEDYHLNRHIELVPASWMSEDTPSFRINGILYTAIVIRETIREAIE